MGKTTVCVGGHDLDRDFRAVRLLKRDGGPQSAAVGYRVGEVWNVRYRAAQCTPPHVEDVLVEGSYQVAIAQKPGDLVRAHLTPWAGGPDSIFDGTVSAAPSGSALIYGRGSLPRCSTGYWLPAHDLVRRVDDEKVRFIWTGDGPIRRFAWVGDAEPPAHIPAGSLVRVSLSRLFDSGRAAPGYYVQISGVL